MGILHGILAELGFEDPQVHLKWDLSPEAGWVTDRAFIPEEGKSYDLAYGKIFYDGQQRYVVKKVRIDGLTQEEWFDIEEGMPLDPGLHGFPVKAYRELGLGRK